MNAAAKVDSPPPETAAALAPVYPWQQALWQQISHADSQRGHAWLFGGVRGCGKRRLVWHWAGWRLCLQPQPVGACGQCVSCQWLQGGAHPDLYHLQATTADGKTDGQRAIRVDAIRNLLPFVQTAGDRMRLVIIDPAELLNQAAANALLKILEEPAAMIHFLLISDQPSRLLPTIRSRVQYWDAGRLDTTAVSQFIADGQTALTATQQSALYQSSYAPLAARELLAGAWQAGRQDWVNDWISLIRNRATAGVRAAVLAAAWQKKLPVLEGLRWCSGIVREVIADRLGLPTMQPDLQLAELSAGTRHTSLGQWFNLYDWCLQQQVLLQQNVQPALIYATLWQQLAALVSSADSQPAGDTDLIHSR